MADKKLSGEAGAKLNDERQRAEIASGHRFIFAELADIERTHGGEGLRRAMRQARDLCAARGREFGTKRREVPSQRERDETFGA